MVEVYVIWIELGILLISSAVVLGLGIAALVAWWIERRRRK